jgi:hypothetical protein
MRVNGRWSCILVDIFLQFSENLYRYRYGIHCILYQNVVYPYINSTSHYLYYYWKCRLEMPTSGSLGPLHHAYRRILKRQRGQTLHRRGRCSSCGVWVGAGVTPVRAALSISPSSIPMGTRIHCGFTRLWKILDIRKSVKFIIITRVENRFPTTAYC